MVYKAIWFIKLIGGALLLVGCETVAVEPTLTPINPRQPLPTVAVRVEVQVEPTPTVAEPEVAGEDVDPPEMPTPPTEADAAETTETPVAPDPAATPEAEEETDPDEPPPDNGPANGEELVALGEEVYQANCATCHQANGQGTAVFPALADNPVVTAEDHTEVLDVIIHGRGEMPAFGDALTEQEIAAVASYIRNAWGNEASSVSEEQVAEVAQSNPEQ